MTGGFAKLSVEQLAKPDQRRSIESATGATVDGGRRLFRDSDLEGLRDRAAAIRADSVANLRTRLRDLIDHCSANGMQVHAAADAAEARAIVVEIARSTGTRRVVKAKSMLSEEIRLNPALAAAGIDVVETDLGERIVQLSDDRPSHLTGPILHRSLAEVRDILAAASGEDLPAEPGALAAHARVQLREAFLRADMGITGVNFGVAETGSICLVTNEGNGRMCTALPRIHVALMGIERVVARLDDLAVLLPLLTGSATAQRATSYTTLIHGPRRPGEPDGPDEVHLVLVDNGRSAIAASQYADVLRCIRCGACQNICPIYRKVGGHAYPWVYGGPIGAVLTPLLEGFEAPGGDLADASTLCAACDDACPVRIPLHELLLGLRRDRGGSVPGSRRERLLVGIWAWAWGRPALYRASIRAARIALAITPRRWAPFAGRWARTRDLPFGRRP